MADPMAPTLPAKPQAAPSDESTADRSSQAQLARPVADPLELAVGRARVEAALFGEARPVRVGRYALIERAGAGGMGVVWSAWDPELGRGVALKLASSGDSAARARARDEGRALARLSHPNVVPIYDVLEADQGVFLVMELVKGETLRAYAARGPSVTSVVRAYRQAGEGLAAAHRDGLIHRDFKPDNAILGADGRVRVLDFGLARDVSSEDAAPEIAGTPRYMAPEQRAGAALTAAVDQYAFCVALRESVSARGPVPRWLEPILVRGAAEQPGARYPSMAELLRALALDPAARWRRRAMIAGGVLSVAAVAGAFVLGQASEDTSCSGGPALIAGIWGGPARAAAALHLAQLRSPYAAETKPRVLGALDRYAAGWVELHRGACQAHRRGEISDALLDRRAGCLARRHAALSAAAELARGAAEPSLPGLVDAIGELPALAACQDDAALVETVAPPPAVLRPVVDSIAAAIAEAEVERAAGKYDAARGHADAALARARATGYRPLIAQALLARGRVSQSTAAGDRGAEVFASAMREAMAAGDEPIVIEAFARHAWAVSTMRGPEHATDGLALVEAMTERIGDHARFSRALLHLNLASVALARGDRPGARALLVQARGEAVGFSGDGAVELTGVLDRLLLVNDDPVERARIGEELVATRTRLLGAIHPRTLAARRRAASLIEDPGLARMAMMPICDDLVRYHPSVGAKIGECGYDVAWLAVIEGDLGAARAAARLIVAAASHGAGSFHLDTAHAVLKLADGDATGAARAMVEIQRTQRAAPDTWWQRLYVADALASEAVARQLTGEPDAARRALAMSTQLETTFADAIPGPVRVRRAAALRGLRARIERAAR